MRVRALGFLDGRLHALVFTTRGEDMRVISFRKANRTEVRRYEKVHG
ncbi:BrnT family toxin [Granulicella arctica]